MYLLLLFVIASWAERRTASKKSLTNNPYVYSLSLAVYCTAWTFYGSVGRAVESGVDFLAVYVGPTIMAPLWWIILRKIIRICKTQRITNIADFVSARYGKSQTLGIIITLVCVVGIIPYISIQLKAISNSVAILSNYSYSSSNQHFFTDQAFYIAVALAIFTILFGTRKIEATERHEGLVAAIAFESILKLIAFLAVGIYLTYFVFDGFENIAQLASKRADLAKLFVIPESKMGQWFWHCFLGGVAIMFLPRQFQVAVVENSDENHLKKAVWLFPLYLFIINIFVMPVALGGQLLFTDGSVKPDSFVLAIPLHFNQNALAMLAYLGGFSAATSMIIVECTAITVMLTNNLVMPLILSRTNWQNQFSNIGVFVLNMRRIFIVVLILFAYLYYRNVSDRYSLVSVGMVSFTAVAQFAPIVIGGIYWKQANSIGAIWGVLIGAFIWFYTLIIPSIVSAGLLPLDLLQYGPYHIEWLRPEALFGLKSMDSLSHGVFWSLLFNTLAFMAGSLWFKASTQEYSQSILFVDVFKDKSTIGNTVTWRGKALISDIRSLLLNFFEQSRADRILNLYARRNNLDLQTGIADPQLISYTEKILGGAIGATSARIVVSSVAKEENIKVDEVIDILKTSQELKSLNRELTRKSKELERLTQQLQDAYNRLEFIDQQKDEFLSTVTHEIRTPLTAIRALSEIVFDNPDMDDEQRKYFLGTVIKESERLTRLINQVLDLERFESGKQVFAIEKFDFCEMIKEATDSIKQLAVENKIKIEANSLEKDIAIWADRDRLMQVVINFLSNAIKFSPKTGAVINVNCTVLNDFIDLSVTDNGEGIEPNFQAMIFDKFYQVADKTHRKPKGSGLGLAISKKIIELHNGIIWVDSQVGVGSTFGFKIPIHHQNNIQ